MIWQITIGTYTGYTGNNIIISINVFAALLSKFYVDRNYSFNYSQYYDEDNIKLVGT